MAKQGGRSVPGRGIWVMRAEPARREECDATRRAKAAGGADEEHGALWAIPGL